MKQLTLATAGFERYAKTTRRATFLAEMEQVVPWRRLCRLIEPVYPKAGNGRPPVGLERMLRIYFLQPGSTCLTRRSRKLSTTRCRCVASSASTWGASQFPTRRRCAASAICWKSTSWAAACSRRSIAISRRAGSRWPRAPSSMRRSSARRRRPRSRPGARSGHASDQEGRSWYFGMKAHIGVDSRTKIIHAVVATAANVADTRSWRICCMARRRGCGATRPSWSN